MLDWVQELLGMGKGPVDLHRSVRTHVMVISFNEDDRFVMGAGDDAHDAHDAAIPSEKFLVSVAERPED